MTATLTPEEARLAVPEAEFQTAVIAQAESLGWRTFHVYDSRRSVAGFPDLVLLRGTRLIFAELKTVKGVCSQEQCDWLLALDQIPWLLVRVWRPTDWSEIEATLGGVSVNQLNTVNDSLSIGEGTTRMAGSVVTAPARHRTGGSNAG